MTIQCWFVNFPNWHSSTGREAITKYYEIIIYREYYFLTQANKRVEITC
jgi:hypothetical protein